jgi:hypothetical protein
MWATPARNNHGGSLLSQPIAIQIEQFPGRIRKGVKIMDEFPERGDSNLSLGSIPNPIDLFDIFRFSLPDLFQKKGKPGLPFAENHVIDQGGSQSTVRVATDMGSSHDNGFLSVPVLDDPGNLQCFPMIRGKGGGNPENIRLGTFNSFSDFFPPHPEMGITRIELERASIIQRIEIFKIGKFCGNGNGLFRFCLTIENLHLVPLLLQ